MWAIPEVLLQCILPDVYTPGPPPPPSDPPQGPPLPPHQFLLLSLLPTNKFDSSTPIIPMNELIDFDLDAEVLSIGQREIVLGLIATVKWVRCRNRMDWQFCAARERYLLLKCCSEWSSQ